jgi:hypothetical protein
MGLKARLEKLDGGRTIRRWPEGLTDILRQEDWVAILDAPDQQAELLRRCPNYYALVEALVAARPDRHGVQRVRI